MSPALDDGVRNLERFVALLVDLQPRLETAGERVRQDAGALDALDDELAAGAAAALEAVEAVESTAREAGPTAAARLGELALLHDDQAGARFEAAAERLDAAEHAVAASLAAALAAAEAEAGEADHAGDAADVALAGLETQCADSGRDLAEALGAAEAAAQSAAEQASTAWEGATQALRAALPDLDGQAAAMRERGTSLDELGAAHDLLDEAGRAMAERCDGAYDAWSAELRDELARHRQQVSDAVEELDRDLTASTDALDAEAEALEAGGCQALDDAVSAASGVAAIGAAAAAPLQALAPLLAAAVLAAERIQELLEELDE